MSEQDQPIWQTWWQIVGPSLTNAETYILPNLVIAPLPPERDKKVGVDLRSPAPQIYTDSRYNVFHYPPYDRVQSEHKLEIHVRAKDQDEAEDKSRLIADDFLTSLTLAVGKGRYHAELKKVKVHGQSSEASGWSQVIAGMVYERPSVISQSEIEATKKLYEAVRSDSIAENAYLHLLTAWKLMETAGSKPLRRSILQHFILSIEAVVNGVMADLRVTLKAKIDKEEEEYANSFAGEIQSKKNKPKAIRDASTKLREIAAVNFLPAVDRVAAALSVSNGIAEDAKNLYRLRSRSLSHPGSGGQEEQDLWLVKPTSVAGVGKADLVARAFLLAYCTRESNGPSSDPEM